jgi:hypothetical protein
MSLLENVAENFGASFKENQFQLDKVYTTWSIAENEKITARQKDRQETNCANKREIGKYSC